MKILLVCLFCLVAGVAHAQAACPNAAATITVPLTGTSFLTIYDQSCNVLTGPFTAGIPGSSLSATTSPSVTNSNGLVFSANGSPSGQTSPMTITHTPSGKTMPFTYTVGTPVTSISGGTTTP